MRIVRTKAYAKALKRLGKLGATASDIVAMEDEIALNPAAGDLIPETGGLRKMRFRYGQTGKRGGGRTVYYALTEETVFMIVAYAKVDKSDLTADEKRLFQGLVKELIHGQSN